MITVSHLLQMVEVILLLSTIWTAILIHPHHGTLQLLIWITMDLLGGQLNK